MCAGSLVDDSPRQVVPVDGHGEVLLLYHHGDGVGFTVSHPLIAEHGGHRVVAHVKTHTHSTPENTHINVYIYT